MLLKAIKTICSITIILLQIANAHSEASVATVDSSVNELELTPYLEWAHDKAGSWSIGEASSKKFATLTSTGLGHLSGSVWLRFRIRNISSGSLNVILNGGDRHVEEIEFFVFDAMGTEKQHGLSGIDHRFSDRTLRSAAIVYPLSIDAGETQTLYLKIKSSFLIQVTPTLSSFSKFYNRDQGANLISFGFYGFIFALLLYNIIIGFSAREPEFAAFSIFVGLWGLNAAGNDGFIYRLWPYELFGGYPSWLYYFIFGISIISMTVFTIVYLRLRKQSPRYIRLQYAIGFTGLLVAVSPVFFPLSVALTLAALSIILAAMINTATGWKMYQSGHRYAAEYTFAFGIMLINYLASVAASYGIIGSYSDSEFFTRLGLLFPMLLFSVGIGNRINYTKEEARKLQQQADAANYAANFKSRFLATMSHEIRTPMNGVLGMAELLKDSQLNHSQQQYIEIIDTSGKALLDVINDILDISKLESGELVLERASISVEELLDDCIGIFAALNKSKEVEFNAFISPNTPAFFMGDPARIKQVLINLLSNAFKFTDNGRISIEISLVEQKSQIFIQFSVSDTGIGISTLEQNKLFSPFTQADESISRKFGGTGLGLAICKELSDAMNGDISVDSVPGKGSTFCFRIPFIIAESESETLNRTLVADLNGKHVLVVDDDPAFLRTMKYTLKSWGMSVSTASNCADTVQHLLETTFDIVLLDNKLPDGNGLELVSDIRVSQKNHQLPIISITAGFDIPTNEKLEQLNIDYHLIKPTKFKTLRSVLTKSLSDGVISNTMKEDYRFEKINVLVIEDNPTNQVVIKAMLSKLGITADICDDGQQGLDLYLASLKSGVASIDIILMDCEMPVMDGYTATKKIREHEATQKASLAVPVVGLSAHALEESRKKAIEAGMNLYLTKPLKIEDLKTSIISLYGNGSRLVVN